MTPAGFSAQLLRALEASEGRRRQRRRDTTPDAVGLRIKRDLLERVVAEAPAPEAFEGWLLQQVAAAGTAGPVHALGLEILTEYRLACADPTFARWLQAGAPSADAADAADDSERPGPRRAPA